MVCLMIQSQRSAVQQFFFGRFCFNSFLGGSTEMHDVKKLEKKKGPKLRA